MDTKEFNFDLMSDKLIEVLKHLLPLNAAYEVHNMIVDDESTTEDCINYLNSLGKIDEDYLVGLADLLAKEKLNLPNIKHIIEYGFENGIEPKEISDYYKLFRNKCSLEDFKTRRIGTDICEYCNDYVHKLGGISVELQDHFDWEGLMDKLIRNFHEGEHSYLFKKLEGDN